MFSESWDTEQQEDRKKREAEEAGTERAASLRRTLVAYYSEHAPEKLENVEALVARVFGGPPTMVGGMMVGGVMWTEDELLSKIASTYGAKVEKLP